MDHPYQSNMQLPAAYAVLSYDEMTYLDGGSRLVLGRAFGYEVSLETEGLATFFATVTANLFYFIASSSFSYITGVIESGYKNGLSPAGTFYHSWNRMNTSSKVAAVGMAGLAGFYAYSQAVSIYKSLRSLYDAVVNPMPDFSGATTATAAAA